jgi:hypothetical protein
MAINATNSHAFGDFFHHLGEKIHAEAHHLKEGINAILHIVHNDLKAIVHAIIEEKGGFSSIVNAMVPRWGYYCGPGWSDGIASQKTKPKSFIHLPINTLDEACKKHDTAYHHADKHPRQKVLEILQADITLVMIAQHITVFSEEEKIYRDALIEAFHLKIKYYDALKLFLHQFQPSTEILTQSIAADVHAFLQAHHTDTSWQLPLIQHAVYQLVKTIPGFT